MNVRWGRNYALAANAPLAVATFCYCECTATPNSSKLLQPINDSVVKVLREVYFRLVIKQLKTR